MKLSKLLLSLLTLSITFLTGCAAGSATAGYALTAQSAYSLSAAAEQRIVNRTKAEVMSELSRQQCANYNYQPQQ